MKKEKPLAERSEEGERSEVQTVPCKWCTRQTRMIGTRCCDSCWELWARVRQQPGLTRRMLRAAGREEKENARLRALL